MTVVVDVYSVPQHTGISFSTDVDTWEEAYALARRMLREGAVYRDLSSTKFFHGSNIWIEVRGQGTPPDPYATEPV